MKVCPVCSAEYADDVKFCPNDGQTLRGAGPRSDLVGQVVADRYHVIKKLGEGGMGQVYLAEHVKMGRRSAIKVMNPSMVHDPDAVARFNREAANASRITHPNVCAIYDFGETPDGLIYLAMEFVEGEPLTDVLERDGALPPARATGIFIQVADALQAAHDLGIVHRDLKPDNVMLARGRDGRDVVKVVDFGIAKAVGGDEAGQKVTKTGLVVGTPEFMSPEQLSGDKVDGRTDLYALALVYYQMLTGRLPFEADSVQETMVKRLIEPPARLSDARPDLTFPPGLQATFDTALARMPAERYQQVGKFAADVATVTGVGRGKGPTAALPATRAAGADERTQVLAAGEAEALARTHAGKASAGGRATAPAAARKRSPLPLVAAAVAVVAVGGFGAVKLLGGKAAGGTGGGADSGAILPTRGDTMRLANTTNRSSSRQGGSTQTQVPPSPLYRSGDSARGSPPAPLQRDSAAVSQDLRQILELVLDAATAADGRRRAMAIYDDAGIPNTLRAQAAFMVANSFHIEQRIDEACRWNGFALTIAPANPQYQQFRADQRCQ